MKIPHKGELHQVAVNRSLYVNCHEFMNLYRKGTARSYSFLVINATLASENPLSMRENLLER